MLTLWGTLRGTLAGPPDPLRGTLAGPPDPLRRLTAMEDPDGPPYLLRRLTAVRLLDSFMKISLDYYTNKVKDNI